jgi:hypothetical protein
MRKKLSLYLELCKKVCAMESKLCVNESNKCFVKEDIIWKLSEQIYLCIF